jgi:hypothetical protein
VVVLVEVVVVGGLVVGAVDVVVVGAGGVLGFADFETRALGAVAAGGTDTCRLVDAQPAASTVPIAVAKPAAAIPIERMLTVSGRCSQIAMGRTPLSALWPGL